MKTKQVNAEGVWIWQRNPYDQEEVIFALRIVKENNRFVVKSLEVPVADLDMYERHGKFISWFHHDWQMTKEKFESYGLDKKILIV